MVEMAFESDVANSAHCMNVLVKQVGLLETERFIAHLSRERTDYTKWRQNQFEDLTLEELAQATRESGKNVRAAVRADAAISRLSSRATKGKDAKQAVQ
jgi:hypothetical protein